MDDQRIPPLRADDVVLVYAHATRSGSVRAPMIAVVVAD